MEEQDRWSRWLLESRFGGDPQYAKEYLDKLREVRDGVLNHRLRLGDGAVLLDVGAGDGLISFGALERMDPTGRVIFSDVSRPLLEHCRSLAGQMGVSERCDFVEARAEDLGPIPNESVDAVTTRSVLIFVADKAAAFREFYRVLKPGGRISLFEPINRYGLDAFKYNVAPVLDLAQRLRDFYRRLQPPDSDPMLNFNEHDLIAHCEAAGFIDPHLALHILVRPAPPQPWERAVAIPGNPNIPAPREAMAQIFTLEEVARYEAHLRPLVEAQRNRHPIERLHDSLMQADYYIAGSLSRAGVKSSYRTFLSSFPDSHFLTFNYDSFLEIMLFHLHRWRPEDGYGLPVYVEVRTAQQPRFPNGSPQLILHLHGSLCVYTSKFEVRWTSEGRRHTGVIEPRGKPLFAFDANSIGPLFPGYDRAMGHGAYHPLDERVIAPVPNKAAGLKNDFVRGVYDQALRLLSDARRLISIGYRFNPHDRESFHPLVKALAAIPGSSLVLVSPDAAETRSRLSGDPRLQIEAVPLPFRAWVSNDFPRVA